MQKNINYKSTRFILALFVGAVFLLYLLTFFIPPPQKPDVVILGATTTPPFVDGSSSTSTPSATSTLTVVSTDKPPVIPVVPPLKTVKEILHPVQKWGAYSGDELVSMPFFESEVGRKTDMHAIFIGWYEPFPMRYAPSVRDQGKTLVLFWEQYDVTLDEIINGSSDDYIDKFARGARAYRGPIMLVPFHEMNGNWAPWSGTLPGNSPAKLIAAWKHIHDRFNGINNVKFAWNVNNGSQPNTPENAIKNYYPGNRYVDYVTVDGFNDGNPWLTWSQLFDDVLSELAQYHKPIYILSMASAPGPQKAEWIKDALSVEIPKHHELAGWIWFNQNKEANWLINSDPASLEAFKKGIPK